MLLAYILYVFRFQPLPAGRQDSATSPYFSSRYIFTPRPRRVSLGTKPPLHIYDLCPI